MDEVTTVLETTNISQIILFMIALICAVVFVMEKMKKIIDALGLKNRWQIHEEEQFQELAQLKKNATELKETLDDLSKYADSTKIKEKEYKKFNDNLIDQINDMESRMDRFRDEINEIRKISKDAKMERLKFEESVSTSLKQIKDEISETRIDALKNKIIDFGNACKNREYNKEAYDNALENYDMYEKLVAMSETRVNGKTEMAISYIKKKYNEYMEKGFPVY